LKLLSDGLFTEICEELKRLDCEFNGREYAADGKVTKTFNEEYLKLVLQRMTLSAGVKLLFHTKVIGVKREGGRISAVTVSNKSGIYDVCGKVFIDATGDADVAFLAGCETNLGRESDNLCQPMTLCFRVANVDIKKFNADRSNMQEKYKRMRTEGRIKNVREDVLVFNTTSDNILHFNSTRVVRYNPVDAEDVTSAEIIAREQVAELFEFLKKNVDGCQNAVLVSTAMRIGVRESRMICGEYTLTKDDLLNCRVPYDTISICNYDIDIHNPEGSGTSHYYFPPGAYYGIAYRCLIARDCVNLLAAGRCISSTHEAQASYRIMPTCCTLGQAAGVAAALALEKSGAVRDVVVEELRGILRSDGAAID
ncbi:MAG: FAD-dependent oxidoreductase, partial [Clostridia bacterium]|nr:FAD-dependent oxidoreductase [Clostridia bacterium]